MSLFCAKLRLVSTLIAIQAGVFANGCINHLNRFIMEQPYKPLLANRLKFPDTWYCVIISIGIGYAGYKVYDSWEQVPSTKELMTAGSGNCWAFQNWEQVLQHLYGEERENRQFCAMVDLITWELQPVQPASKIQRTLNFDNNLLD